MFKKICLCSFLVSICFADVNVPSINDLMSIEDQRKTGVIGLKQKQKMELAKWLVQNGYAKGSEAPNAQKGLTLVMNDKRNLELNDGSLWEVAPEDVRFSSTWGINVEVQLERTSNPLYPYNLINVKTKEKVKVRIPFD